MSMHQLGALLGGIGLFLLGMWLMTEGLKVAAGDSLRGILSRWTRTRMHGLAAGFAVTALVQSSSAVTIATLGFVNAGLLTLSQAVWVAFGANVGTTVTGWLVSAVGFNLRIDALALPMIGIGAVLRLVFAGSRRGALGEALAGLGLFFLGVAVLADAFASVADVFDAGAMPTSGFIGIVVFVFIGFAVTLLTQSSSASIAVALSAAAGGVVGLEPAAAMVIGANLGTAPKALLVVLGATPNAKRVALAHVFFNLVAAAVALLLLPVMLGVVRALTAAFDMPDTPVTALALFHTVFNLLGVALMWPIATRLIEWLSRRFVSAEENEAEPRYLDRTGIHVPQLAVESLVLELRRVAALSAAVARSGVDEAGAAPAALAARQSVVERLSAVIMDYTRKLGAARLQPALADALVHPLRMVQHATEMARLGVFLATRRSTLTDLSASLGQAVAAYRELVTGCLSLFDSDRGAEDDSVLDGMSREVEENYQRLKTQLLQAGIRGQIGPVAADEAIAAVDALRRLGHRALKAARRLALIQRSLVAEASTSEELIGDNRGYTSDDQEL